MITDWRDREIDRLRERIDRIERTRWEESQRAFERRTRIMVAIIWIEVALASAAIWAFSIAKAAGV